MVFTTCFWWDTEHFFKKCYVGAQFINNALLVSYVQQNDSVLHMHVSIPHGSVVNNLPTMQETWV